MRRTNRWMARSARWLLVILLVAATGCSTNPPGSNEPGPLGPTTGTGPQGSTASRPPTGPLTGSVDGSFVPTGTGSGGGMSTLTIGAAKVRQGESVVVPIEFETSVPVEVVSFSIFIKNSELGTVAVARADGFEGRFEAVPDSTPFTINVEVRPEKPLLGKVTLGTITGKAAGKPGMTVAITINRASASTSARDLVPLPLVRQDGRVDVLAPAGSSGGPEPVAPGGCLIATGGSIKPGYVEVSIDWLGDMELRELCFGVRFDTRVLAVDGVRLGPVVAPSSPPATSRYTMPWEKVENNEGSVSFGASYFKTRASSGNVATIKFMVIGKGAGTQTVIQFSGTHVNQDANGMVVDIPCRKIDATVKITD